MFKLLPVLFALALVAAAQSPLEDCVKTFDASKDCFTSKATNDDAKLFSVTYSNYYKIVTVKPTFGAPSNYSLVIRGAPTTGVPTNVNGTFTIPVQKVAVYDTTTVPFIELLNQRASIAAADSEDFISSPCVQQRQANKDIVAINSASVTTANTQLASVDAIFSGIGVTAGIAPGKWVSQAATSDPGPLNRAEWLEFFAQWYGLEGTAQTITSDIFARYAAAKAAAAKAVSATPVKVAWVSYSAPSSFNNNQATWSFSASAFKKAFVADAGATLITPDTASYTDINAFKKAIVDADAVVWEDFSTGKKLTDFQTAFGNVDASFKFIKNSAVYTLDKRSNSQGGTDWFESAVAYPHLVLLDIISFVAPTAAPKGYSRWYLRNVANEAVTTLTASNCVNLAEAVSIPGPSMDQIKAGSPAAAAAPSSASAAGVSAGAAAVAIAALLLQ